MISIDVEARRAVVQPIISNREAQKILNAKGLAFPSGHCPQVKLSGYYIGESDTVVRPSNAVQAFKPENWQRLADLRDKHDPDGVFFGYFDGLAQK